MLLTLLQVLFIGLKLADVIAWPWLLVFSPALLALTIMVIAIIAIVTVETAHLRQFRSIWS